MTLKFEYGAQVDAKSHSSCFSQEQYITCGLWPPKICRHESMLLLAVEVYVNRAYPLKKIKDHI